MTGRDLILYILSNGLEDEPVFKDGKFIGFTTLADVAKKNNVGLATITTRIRQGKLNSVIVEEGVYVPANCTVRGE